MSTRTWCSLVVGGCMIAGCGGSKPLTSQIAPAHVGVSLDTTAQRIFAAAQDTSITPLVAGWPPSDFRPAVEDRVTEAEQPTGAGSLYRIQLFTSKSMAEAASVRDEAALEFDCEVRVDYETPYYKVRMGQFSTPQEAEPTLKRARQLGYRGAWAVRVRDTGTRD